MACRLHADSGPGRPQSARLAPAPHRAGDYLQCVGDLRVRFTDQRRGFEKAHGRSISRLNMSGAAGRFSRHQLSIVSTCAVDSHFSRVGDESRGTLVLLLPDSDAAYHPVLRRFEPALP
jgi:hypothetical protein